MAFESSDFLSGFIDISNDALIDLLLPFVEVVAADKAMSLGCESPPAAT